MKHAEIPTRSEKFGAPYSRIGMIDLDHSSPLSQLNIRLGHRPGEKFD